MNLHWSNRKIYLVIVLLPILLYSNTILNDYNIDDELVTRSHPLTSQGIKAIPQILITPYYQDEAGNSFGYRPLVLSSFALEHQLFGEKAWISHAINVILYAICSLLLFISLRLLLRNYHPFIPIAASIIFIFHPLHTEVVASIKNRDEILSLIFSLFAAYSAFKYLDSKKFLFLVLMFFSYFLAVLGKLSALPMVVIIPLLAILFRPQRLLPIILISSILSIIAISRIPPQSFLPRFMILSLLLSWPVIAFYIYHSLFRRVLIAFAIILPLLLLTLLIPDKIENYHWTSDNPVLSILFSNADIIGRKLNFSENPLGEVHSLSTQIGTSLNSLLCYTKLMLFPYPLRYYYGYDQVPIITMGHYAAGISGLLHLMLFLIALYCMKRFPPLSAGIFIYLLCISLYINLLVPVAGILGERLAFQASAGFSLAIAAVFSLILKEGQQSLASLPKWFRLSAILFIITFGLFTIYRNTIWKDKYKLVETDLDHLHNSAKANYLFAVIQMEQFQIANSTDKQAFALEKAINHYQKTLDIYPEFPYAWFDLGVAYTMNRDGKSATQSFIQSTKVDSSNALSWYNAGYLLENAGQSETAKFYYKNSIRLDSMNMDAHKQMWNILVGEGKNYEALPYLEYFVKNDPSDPELNKQYLELCKELGEEEKMRDFLEFLLKRE